MKKQTKVKETVEAKNAGATKGKAGKPTTPKAKTGGQQGEPGASTDKVTQRFPRDPRNPFRAGSAYGIAYDILAAHPDGMPKPEWIRLLAEAMGKTEKLAGFNVQVLMTAKRNADGSNSNNSPRHKACRPGFFVTKDGDTVKLGVDAT